MLQYYSKLQHNTFALVGIRLSEQKQFIGILRFLLYTTTLITLNKIYFLPLKLKL